MFVLYCLFGMVDLRSCAFLGHIYLVLMVEYGPKTEGFANIS